jgi:hypothetical protein
MRFTRSVDGTHFVGVSKTQAAHPVQDGAKPIHEPTVEKHFYAAGQVPTYPGHYDRRDGARRDDANRILHASILGGKKRK